MGSPMERKFAPLTRKVVIANQRGLHARAAAKFVKLAGGFEAEIFVAKNEIVVPGGSIMALMMLAAGPGCELELRAQGPEARKALRALERLVTNGFGEE